MKQKKWYVEVILFQFILSWRQEASVSGDIYRQYNLCLIITVNDDIGINVKLELGDCAIIPLCYHDWIIGGNLIYTSAS